MIQLKPSRVPAVKDLVARAGKRPITSGSLTEVEAYSEIIKLTSAALKVIGRGTYRSAPIQRLAAIRQLAREALAEAIDD